MSKTYNKYINNEDHTWYDSSNIIYSVCYDAPSNTSLKIVFKGGKTYLYRNVDPAEYTLFRDAESNGKAFNQYIRKYDTIKLDDTDLNQLETMKTNFIEMDGSASSLYNIVLNNQTGDFIILSNGKPVFEGTEGKVSIMKLFKSLSIPFLCKEDNNVKLSNIGEFENKKIVNNSI